MKTTVRQMYCSRCGAAHVKACRPQRLGGADWPAVMAYQVKQGREMTLEEIGEVMGCSREYVRQIEFAALRKLANRGMVRAAVREALTA